MNYMPRPASDLDEWITLSEARAHDANRREDDAFVAAMAKAIRRGREKMPPPPFLDPAPRVARRFYPQPHLSPCGSPAAMCADIGGSRFAETP